MDDVAPVTSPFQRYMQQQYADVARHHANEYDVDQETKSVRALQYSDMRHGTNARRRASLMKYGLLEL